MTDLSQFIHECPTICPCFSTWFPWFSPRSCAFHAGNGWEWGLLGLSIIVDFYGLSNIKKNGWELLREYHEPLWIIPSFPIWSTGKRVSYWSTVFWLLLGLRTSFTRTTRRSGMLDSSLSDHALKPERGRWELMALVYDNCRYVRIVVVWSSDYSIFEMILRVLICKK